MRNFSISNKVKARLRLTIALIFCASISMVFMPTLQLKIFFSVGAVIFFVNIYRKHIFVLESPSKIYKARSKSIKKKSLDEADGSGFGKWLVITVVLACLMLLWVAHGPGELGSTLFRIGILLCIATVPFTGSRLFGSRPMNEKEKFFVRKYLIAGSAVILLAVIFFFVRSVWP